MLPWGRQPGLGNGGRGMPEAPLECRRSVRKPPSTSSLHRPCDGARAVAERADCGRAELGRAIRAEGGRALPPAVPPKPAAGGRAITRPSHGIGGASKSAALSQLGARLRRPCEGSRRPINNALRSTLTERTCAAGRSWLPARLRAERSLPPCAASRRARATASAPRLPARHVRRLPRRSKPSNWSRCKISLSCPMHSLHSF
mmetsp:Transcript_75672/g.201039  ORF Transcript_75672/g.201039 Transcript_75672/m.201039 type:complete len:202 (-) Transcript_75672:267-872(-)